LLVHAEFAEKLMRTGLDEAESKRYGPLHLAAWTNCLEMCDMPVKDCGCNPNATNADGN